MFAVVDRFRIVEKLGAKVWKCEDFSRDGETVVVKCLNDENELKILRALRLLRESVRLIQTPKISARSHGIF